MRSVLAPRGTAFPPLEAAERLGCGTEIFGTTLRAFIPNIILFHVDLSRFRYGRWAAQHYTVENTLFITSSVWIISCTKVSLLAVTLVLSFCSLQTPQLD